MLASRQRPIVLDKQNEKKHGLPEESLTPHGQIRLIRQIRQIRTTLEPRCRRSGITRRQLLKNLLLTSHSLGKNRWEIVFCRYLEPSVPPVPDVSGPMMRSTSWTCRKRHSANPCSYSSSPSASI